MSETLAMTHACTPGTHTVEGIARVVSIDGEWAWLEPEQTGGCGSCASASSCGAKGIGTVASRMAARRFRLDNAAGFRVGERVVLGIDDRALVKASLLAYAIPLGISLLAGGLAQGAWGSDLATMGAMAAGLLVGFMATRIGADRLSAHGELSPRFLRRAQPGESCNQG